MRFYRKTGSSTLLSPVLTFFPLFWLVIGLLLLLLQAPGTIHISTKPGACWIGINKSGKQQLDLSKQYMTPVSVYDQKASTEYWIHQSVSVGSCLQYLTCRAPRIAWPGLATRRFPGTRHLLYPLPGIRCHFLFQHISVLFCSCLSHPVTDVLPIYIWNKTWARRASFRDGCHKVFLW